MHGIQNCNILLDLQIYTNIDLIITKKIEGNNVLILNKSTKVDIIYVKTFSKISDTSPLQLMVDNTKLIESDVLLPKNYITPNYIDSSIFESYKYIHIYGKMISHIILENISVRNLNILNNSNLYKLSNSVEYIKKYKDNKIFLNNIAFIGDEFTYNSLNNIVNVKYISKKDVHNIDIDSYDALFCESTWDGMDNTWRYAFNLYKVNKYSKELKYIITEFKKKNKTCIFYNKEDPIHYDKFYNSAELFDIIVTTSKRCIKKYKDNYPEKKILNLPFLCNPIIHNPIGNKKEKTIYFIGGFYNHLTGRTTQINKLFTEVISNNYNLAIINRHYFFPKITRQINNFIQHQNKYEISREFKQFEYPSVTHLEAVSIYKNSLFHLNINTITDCKTMSSRRLIELLACGCNVFSNNSKSIEYFNLPVITDLANCNKDDIMNEYNVNGFYLTHIKYSYVYLLKILFTISNINIKNNIHIKITCVNESNISDKFKSLLKIKEYDFELLLEDDIYYNVETIEKLLVYPYFFNGNVCFTDDKYKYFTVENGLLSMNCIIKYHKNSNQTLFIPRI